MTPNFSYEYFGGHFPRDRAAIVYRLNKLGYRNAYIQRVDPGYFSYVDREVIKDARKWWL